MKIKFLDGSEKEFNSLIRANLSKADLSRANLYRANLYRANLSGAIDIPKLIAAQLSITPKGNLVGWKKCRDKVIVKLLVPQRARRSNATGRKCRAEYVQVLKIFGAEIGISNYCINTIYRVGKEVRCDEWNEDRWQECGGGIHFFLTREEAENY